MRALWSFIKNLFHRKNVINFDINAPTIPEGFGYPEHEFSILVKELTQFIRNEDRLITLDSYLRGPLFKKFNLDLNDPMHAAVLGYAFCAAVISQRAQVGQEKINAVLREFYPDKMKKKLN